MVMSKSMSVQFADGTSHTYDDVPDDVTQEQLNARAQSDFGDKTIAGVNEGAHPDAAPAPTTEQQGAVEPSIAAKVGGGLQTGWNVANEFLTSPVGHAAEIVTGGWGAKKGIINPIINAIQNKGAIPPTAAPIPPTAPVNAAPRPSMMPPSGAVPPTAPVNAAPRPGMMPPSGAVPPTAGTLTAPQMPTTAAANPGWITKALDSAKQYAAPIENAVGKAAPVVKGMAKLAAPLAVASELFYTSPEERAILQQEEAKKRAKGWKPANER